MFATMYEGKLLAVAIQCYSQVVLDWRKVMRIPLPRRDDVAEYLIV